MGTLKPAFGVSGGGGVAPGSESGFLFESIAARDTFFTSNPGLLISGFPVFVVTSANTVTPYTWTGATAPVSYDAAKFEMASIQSSSNSFELSDAVTMSLAGSNVAFTDNLAGTSAHPVFQTFADGNTAFVKYRTPRPDETYSVKTSIITNPTWSYGPFAESRTIRAITLDFPFFILGLRLTIEIGGVTVYRKALGHSGIGEQKIEIEPNIDLPASETLTVSIDSTDGYPASARGSSATGIPWSILESARYEPFQVATIPDLSSIKILRETLIQQSSAAASQEPASLDTPIVIEFGPAFGGPTDPINLSSTGVFTVNETGQYHVRPFAHFGRSSSAGEAELYFKLVVNGSNYGHSAFARLDDDDTFIPLEIETTLDLQAGDTFHYEFTRDSSLGGINNGGLFRATPNTAGFNPAPSASILISRTKVVL